MDLQMMLLDVIYFILRNSVRAVLRPRTKPIDGELVLITGAGGGLGRLFAQEFAKHGAEVVLWDIDSGSNEQTAKLVRELGGRAQTYTVDVTNKEDVYRCAELVRQGAGRDVTMLVNNAGVVAGKRMLDCPDELMERTMKVNCHALFWVRITFRKLVPECGSRTARLLFNWTFLGNYSQKTSQRDVVIRANNQTYSYNEVNEQHFWASVIIGLNFILYSPHQLKVWLLHNG